MATEIILSKQTMSSLEIAELAVRRHKDVLESIRSMEPAWEKITGRKFRLSEYKDPSGRLLPCYELDYKECMYIASKFNDETRAKLVLRWDDLETGKTEPMVSQPKSKRDQYTLSDKMKVATWLIKTLNLHEHSKLTIAKSIADPLELPTPEFVEDEVMLPISKLLKKKGIIGNKGKSMSGQEGNKKLLEAGLIEQVSRYSRSRGKEVQNWIITDKGKKYGKMHQFKDASFPSPVWFIDKSDELMSLLGLSAMEGTNDGN